MPRHVLRNTLAAVLISAAASSYAAAQEITVTGAADRVAGHTNFGAEILEYTASLVVNVDDLDLDTATGWNAAERRLSNASRAACDAIDQRISMDLRPDRSECERITYRRAMTLVRELRSRPSS